MHHENGSLLPMGGAHDSHGEKPPPNTKPKCHAENASSGHAHVFHGASDDGVYYWIDVLHARTATELACSYVGLFVGAFAVFAYLIAAKPRLEAALNAHAARHAPPHTRAKQIGGAGATRAQLSNAATVAARELNAGLRGLLALLELALTSLLMLVVMSYDSNVFAALLAARFAAVYLVRMPRRKTASVTCSGCHAVLGPAERASLPASGLLADKAQASSNAALAACNCN